MPPPKDLKRTVVIENVAPIVDGGRYPIKRVVGDVVEVTADVFKEGHDVLVAFVRYRRADETGWRETEMRALDYDRWTGRFVPDANARWVFTVEALADPFQSWLVDLRKRQAVGQDAASELLEGAALVRAAADRATGADGAALRDVVARLAAAPGDASVFHDPTLLDLMRRTLDRSEATWGEYLFEVVVDRERARFAAWYEFFPRSARGDGRHATLRDAEAMLERAAAMGFDTVYLPPIHPIGRAHRKGRNDALTTQPGDPGSPWAIGAAEGGHTALHPELGTLADFERFVARAGALGLEVALDFAVQCSPDHPWVREHPEWFFHRPDGSIKYAENPPKKYQDVYQLNFVGDDPGPLWEEMKRVVEFWIGHGVRTFRVDNPHTKPLRFWEWLIREVQAKHPGAIFLAEAFTRPAMMRALSKAGFTQSYTYFTWHNSKHELIDYLSEITRPPVSEYFRGNLWPNTPDILQAPLVHGGPAAFRARLVLAATLSPLFGIYSGYELCENVPREPGSEEYLDSEKYELKRRDWSAPGNLTDWITRVNGIRRAHRALQRHDNLVFLACDDPNVLWYGRWTPERDDCVFVAVNLDPFGRHATMADMPLRELGLAPDATYGMHDELSGATRQWRGPRGYVELDPSSSPAQIFHLRR